MPDACDFSFTKPSPAQLVAAGVKCAIVYLIGAGKAITGPEVQAYVDAGIVVCFVDENTATDISSGHGGGLLRGAAISYALAELNLDVNPTTQPVYSAVDQNLDLTQIQTSTDLTGYFVGLSRVRDPQACGAYSTGPALDFLGATGLASYFWQSASTSYIGNGPTIPAAHIRQLNTPPAVPGTDNDQLLQGDVGQYPRP